MSGLRLSEALNLSWDDDRKILVDMNCRRPMFVIRAELEKGNQDRLLPMTPDFAELLNETPEHERTGSVFRPLTKDGSGRVALTGSVSASISGIGKAANVVVSRDGKKTKYASAHDLRRSFGERWSKRAMAAILQQLMRHEDIQTTLRFYVGQNAEAVADEVWKLSTSVAPYPSIGSTLPG